MKYELFIFLYKNIDFYKKSVIIKNIIWFLLWIWGWSIWMSFNSRLCNYRLVFYLIIIRINTLKI